MSPLQALDRTVRLVHDFVPVDVLDTTIVDAFRRFRVQCVSDKTNLETHSGQTALITLVSLIARMGVQVDLDVPEIPLVSPQPPLTGPWLRAGLHDLGGDLVPGSRIESGAGGRADLLLTIGDTPQPTSHVASWRLTGTDWAGGLAPSEAIGGRWTFGWPIGAMVAAVLATTEVFKAILRTLPLGDAYHARYLQAIPSVDWDFSCGPSIPLVADCGSLDIISAGAISQSALFVLLRLPLGHGHIRVFDDDVADISNLNRGMLLRRSDIGQNKAQLMARHATPTLAITPFPERFQLETGTPYLPLSPAVLVGVDDIPSRWEAQRAAAGWLGVGATSHYEASSSTHNPGQACAGCLHPIDDPLATAPVPTVSFVSFWAGLALAVRFLRHRLGVPYPGAQQHLWLAPLRMDSPLGACWFPVAPRTDCPVGCRASRTARARTAA